MDVRGFFSLWASIPPTVLINLMSRSEERGPPNADNEKLYAPDTFLLEMDNLICKWIRRGIVTHPEGDEIRNELRCQPIEFFPFRELLDYAFEIASRTGCSLYDCLYLALAVSLKGKIATADRRLCERLDQTPFSKYVRLITEIF